MIGMKEQCFGVEIEMTGITREEAARALADYFGTTHLQGFEEEVLLRIHDADQVFEALAVVVGGVRGRSGSGGLFWHNTPVLWPHL